MIPIHVDVNLFFVYFYHGQLDELDKWGRNGSGTVVTVRKFGHVCLLFSLDK